MKEKTTRTKPPSQRNLLAPYKERAPKMFIQYDACDYPRGSYADDDGIEHWQSVTWDLMAGSMVRTLIDPNADRSKVVSELLKLAYRIEHGPEFRDIVDEFTLI